MAWESTGNIRGPEGPAGPQGPQGVKGSTGTRGSKWFSGVGTPGTLSGQLTGDWYLDTATADVYERTSTAWVKRSSIRGPAGDDGLNGTRGSLWFNGVGNPQYVAGVHNHLDMYLDNRTGTVWQYTSDLGWTSAGRLQGEAQICVLSMSSGYSLTVPSNTDTVIPGGSSWGKRRSSAAVDALNSGNGWRFLANQTGYYRITYNINGGRTDAPLSVKATLNSPTVGGNTIFSWAGHSHESAVSATGVFRLNAGDSVYPVFWAGSTWAIIAYAFGQANTSVTMEFIGP